MLGDDQRNSFFFFLDTMSRILQESQDESKLDNLQRDVNQCLALIERDFPVSKMVSRYYISILKLVKKRLVILFIGHVCSFITPHCSWNKTIWTSVWNLDV